MIKAYTIDMKLVVIGFLCNKINGLRDVIVSLFTKT